MWYCRKGLWKNDNLSHLRGLWHFTTTRKLGDARAARVRQRALLAANAPQVRLILPRQVHGRRVLALKGNSRPASPRADGLVTSKPGVALGMVSADCLPIFLVDVEHRAAALVHAGWRGLSQGILRRAARVMKKSFGTRPSRCLAAIGPHIHSCCYEVGLEVARLFHPSCRRPVVHKRMPLPRHLLSSPLEGEDSGGGWRSSPERVRGQNRYRLNLGMVASRQLRRLGFPLRFSEVCPACTGCRPKQFFSYRRERTDKRHLSAIGFYGN